MTEPMDEGGEGEDVVSEARRNRFHDEFKEFNETRQLIDSLESIHQDQIAVERCLERFVYIVDQYQEQPHLLNPHLEALLKQILGLAMKEGQPEAVVHLAFRLLYLITKTRGYKVMVSLMPHEVTDLPPLLELINRQSPLDHQTWETRYMLLLWLSMACMIPFDLARLDGLSEATKTSDKKGVMDQILEIGLTYIEVTDKSRDSAAYMLAHFLTRPDVRREKFVSVLDLLLSKLSSTNLTTRIGKQTASGLLLLLASLFKYSQRQDLIQTDVKILGVVRDKIGAALERIDDTLLRKLYIKLIQRIGLNLLPTRVAKWRYKRGRRVLAENVGGGGETFEHGKEQEGVEREEEEEFDVPEQIEDVIEILLSGLKDKDTVVRWSAAKGIGRVTGRLPRELADEVVGSVMDLFSPLQTDSAWHGGCLTLAELGRRGLLLPQRLPDVIPIVLRALQYDERQGTVSIGSNVRDSACYVCWAFARAYEVNEIKPHVERIATALVIVSLFDRQINVRRAAAAAFQEHVGRQGQFPHGIDVLTLCDYFTVSLRSNCYLNLCVSVADFEEYTLPLIEHLLHIKSYHWDLEIRELSASSLHLLTAKAPEFMAHTAVPLLLKNCLVSDFNTHHGAILSIAHVTHALYLHARHNNKRLEEVISEESLNQLRNVTQQVLALNYVRGSCAEPMRKALCCLIEKLSLSSLPFDSYDVVGVWQKLINESLQHVDLDVQAAAVKALPALCNEYYQQIPALEANKGLRKAGMYCRYKLDRSRCELIDSYIQELGGSIESSRCGYALALGSLPKFMLKGQVLKVISALISATTITDKKYKAFAESRRDAVKALTSISSTVGVEAAIHSDDRLCTEIVQRVYKALVSATEDYTLDSRGDVGAWVREAAMQGLYEVSLLLISSDPNLFTQQMCEAMVCCLVQQACEKIDRTRFIAGSLFAKLLHHSPEVPHIPHRCTLMEVFSTDLVSELNWAAPALTFPLFTKLLPLQQYTYSVLLGLTASCGGITESLVKHAVASMSDYLMSIDTDSSVGRELASQLITALLEVMRRYERVDRVIVPLLRMLDRLLANNSLLSLLDLFLQPPATDNSNRTSDSTEQCSEIGYTEQLCQLCRSEVSKCKDVQKILVSIDVFCGLAQVGLSADNGGELVRRLSLSQLSLFLCHSYPIVRKTTANKFYELVVVFSDQLICSGNTEQQQQLSGDEAVERVSTILTDTLWDQPLEQIRPMRNEICDLLGIPRPVLLKQQQQQ